MGTTVAIRTPGFRVFDREHTRWTTDSPEMITKERT